MSGGGLCGHVEYFSPASLKSANTVEFVQADRAFVAEGDMWPEEVVMGDEEDGKRESAVEVLEAASGSCMELVCAVKAFDKLFVWSELLAFRIVVFEAGDGAAYDGVAVGLRINEVYG